MKIEVTIPGTPVGKGRPRFSKVGRYVHTYTPEKTKAYEANVAACYQAQAGHMAPEGVPVYATILAYFPIPQSTSKRQKALLEGTSHIKKPDTDNVVKSILDGLNGIAFPDDSAVQLARAEKFQTNAAPRVELTLEWEEA